MEPVKIKGQKQDSKGKCKCDRCKKILNSINFYTHRDGSKCIYCKPCLTAHIDNFDPTTFEWVLELMDVPYIPSEWNSLRDKAFAKNPYKMNGMSVIGKYLAKMKLKQWQEYTYKDTPKLLQKLKEAEQQKKQEEKENQEKYEKELKEKLKKGEISSAQYKTLVSTETQNKELEHWGDKITGVHAGNSKSSPTSYEEALNLIRNPFQQQNFLSENELPEPGQDLDKEDKLYLAMKWGRLYRPSQWVALQQLYNQFMNSFDIQGAARIDTLKMICKTSLKMNEAIDSGDIDTFQKLSRVYDSMMKSAKFTEAQNKQEKGNALDSASAIVDFVQAHSGEIPKYNCNQPKDIVDKIIYDLKQYNRNLIYEDKSLAQEIEKYLQNKKISEEMRQDRKVAKQKGLHNIELEDEDYQIHKQNLNKMKEHDNSLTDEIIEKEYEKRRVHFDISK